MAEEEPLSQAELFRLITGSVQFDKPLWLSGAKLNGAKLYGAYLNRAWLTGADLRGADLQDIDLSGADLIRAILSDADLTGADLRWAKYNANTQWPEGRPTLWERVCSVGMSNDKETATVYERTPWHTARIWAIPGMVMLLIFLFRQQGRLFGVDLVISAPIFFLSCLLINRVCVGIYRKYSRPPDFEWVATMPFLLFLVAITYA